MGQSQRSSHFGSDRGLQRPPQTDLRRPEAFAWPDHAAAGVRADFQTLHLGQQGSSLYDPFGFSLELKTKKGR